MSVSTEPRSSRSELFDRLAEFLRELHGLRSALPSPAVDDGPHRLHDQLIKARRSLDRAEAILAQIGRVRAAAREQVASAKRSLKVAEDEALQKRKKAFSDYISTRERLAWLAGQREVKVAQQSVWFGEEQLARIDAAYEEAQLLWRGIDGVRREVDTRLRIMTYERSLER